MRVIASFAGKNKDFRAWLAAQKYPGRVVSLAEWRKKKAASRAAKQKPSSPSIA